MLPARCGVVVVRKLWQLLGTTPGGVRCVTWTLPVPADVRAEAILCPN